MEEVTLDVFVDHDRSGVLDLLLICVCCVEMCVCSHGCMGFPFSFIYISGIGQMPLSRVNYN